MEHLAVWAICGRRRSGRRIGVRAADAYRDPRAGDRDDWEGKERALRWQARHYSSLQHAGGRRRKGTERPSKVGDRVVAAEEAKSSLAVGPADEGLLHGGSRCGLGR